MPTTCYVRGCDDQPAGALSTRPIDDEATPRPDLFVCARHHGLLATEEWFAEDLEIFIGSDLIDRDIVILESVTAKDRVYLGNRIEQQPWYFKLRGRVLGANDTAECEILVPPPLMQILCRHEIADIEQDEEPE